MFTHTRYSLLTEAACYVKRPWLRMIKFFCLHFIYWLVFFVCLLCFLVWYNSFKIHSGFIWQVEFWVFFIWYFNRYFEILLIINISKLISKKNIGICLRSYSIEVNVLIFFRSRIILGSFWHHVNFSFWIFIGLLNIEISWIYFYY
jgi:hypothetical protein